MKIRNWTTSELDLAAMLVVTSVAIGFCVYVLGCITKVW